MGTARKHTRYIALMVLLTALPMFDATAGLEKHYRRAMDAYRSRQWELAEKLSRRVIMDIDAAEWKDWTYTGEHRPFDAYFSGDLVYFQTSETGEVWPHSRVELYDPARDRLVRVFDYTPWEVQGCTHTKNYSVTYIGKSDFLGYRILWFKKGDPSSERTILREGIEIYDAERLIDTDYFDILEKGPQGWTLSILDLESGEMREVHRFGQIELTQKFWSQFRVVRGDDFWTFIDGNRIYSLEVGTWRKRVLNELPFKISAFDNFCKECNRRFSAVRGDTLFFIPPLGTANRRLRTIQLPYPMEITHETGACDVDDSGSWFARSDADSLRIFRISGGRARPVLGTTSCIGGTYKLSTLTFWKGDTLVHFGNRGLKIFKGPKRIYSIEAEDLNLKYDFDRKLFYIYKAPGEFSVLNATNLEILWKKRYNVTHTELLDVMKGGYFLINHIDGTSLLDIRTGDELLRIHEAATNSREVSGDTTKILLAGENFLGVYEISRRQQIRNDMIAVSAVSRWAANDTAGALQQARAALDAGTNLSGDLPENLHRIFTDLGLRKESLRMMGAMAIKTGEQKWIEKLRNEGAEFFIEPLLADFFAYVTTERGLFAFPILTYPFSVARGEAKRCYWLERPHYEPEEMMLPTAGIAMTNRAFVFFQYERDPSGEKLLWNALLLTLEGEFENLGRLLETPIEQSNPNRQLFAEYALDFMPDSDTKDRALTNCIFRNFEHSQNYEWDRFVISLDLTGAGNNWHDMALRDPVAVGRRFYAHRRYGDLISTIAEGSQADSIGIRVGDVVISFGGHELTNTLTVNEIKRFFPDRAPMDIVIQRGADTLQFTVLNGRIGYEFIDCFTLVEIDPENGRHIGETMLPPGFALISRNSSGELVYQAFDTILFYDPITQYDKRVVINDLKYYRRMWTNTQRDVLEMQRELVPELLVLNVSKTADDEERVLWKQEFEDVFMIENIPRWCMIDDIDIVPVVLNDGTLLLHDLMTGSVLARETVPFRNFGWIPQIEDGVLHGQVASRMFGWRIEYFHPPFPWKNVGFGALGVIPLFFVGLLLNRIREDRLKKKHHRELKKAEIEAEIAAARNLQAGLIPTGSYLLGDFEVVGKFIPASEVAGDYFDFHLLDDGRLVAVMGDVTGHGLPAGILVSMAKASLMTVHRTEGVDFKDTLESLNDVVRNGAPSKDMFMTLCYLVADPISKKIGCSANGHPFPLIARSDGTVAEVGTGGGYPLGVRDRQDFRIVETAFKPGDTILLYTDGIPEQLNDAGEPWGYEKFFESFQALSKEKTESMVDKLLQKAVHYAGHAIKGDDMALIAIRYNPA